MVVAQDPVIFAGSARENVNRQLQAWKRRCIVDLGLGWIAIRRRADLVPVLADGCQLVLYDANMDIWFSHVRASEHDDHKGTSSSHSRIEQVKPKLAATVREAVRVDQMPDDVGEELESCRRGGGRGGGGERHGGQSAGALFMSAATPV